MVGLPIIPSALAAGGVALLAIATAFAIGLRMSGHWRAARDADRRAARPAQRMRATIDYRATMDRMPAPEGLSPERLRARDDLLDASARMVRAKAARKDTKRHAASVVKARAELLAMDLKMKRTAP